MPETFARRLSRRSTLAPNDPDRIREPRIQHARPPKLAQRPWTLLEIQGPSARELPDDPPDLCWYVTALRCRLDGSEWDDDGWLNMKVHASTSVRHKANYWLSWYHKEKRLNHRPDSVAMRTLRPRLHTTLIAALTVTGAIGYEHRPYALAHEDAQGRVCVEADPVIAAWFRREVAYCDERRARYHVERLNQQFLGWRFALAEEPRSLGGAWRLQQQKIDAK